MSGVEDEIRSLIISSFHGLVSEDQISGEELEQLIHDEFSTIFTGEKIMVSRLFTRLMKEYTIGQTQLARGLSHLSDRAVRLGVEVPAPIWLQPYMKSGIASHRRRPRFMGKAQKEMLKLVDRSHQSSSPILTPHDLGGQVDLVDPALDEPDSLDPFDPSQEELPSLDELEESASRHVAGRKDGKGAKKRKGRMTRRDWQRKDKISALIGVTARLVLIVGSITFLSIYLLSRGSVKSFDTGFVDDIVKLRDGRRLKEGLTAVIIDPRWAKWDKKERETRVDKLSIAIRALDIDSMTLYGLNRRIVAVYSERVGVVITSEARGKK